MLKEQDKNELGNGEEKVTGKPLHQRLKHVKNNDPWV